MSSRVLAIATLLVGLAPLCAQGRTWIVDQNNGPGTDFLDLPPAVAQAQDGDTLIVRQGSYCGFTTGKALTVLGEGTVQVTRFLPLPPLPAIEITGLAQDKTFVMKNLRVAALHSTGRGTALFSANRGRIHLEDVHVDGMRAFVAQPIGLRVADCDAVTVTGGQLDGWPGVLCTSSLLALTGVAVVGGSASNSPRGSRSSGVGLGTTDSTLLLSRTDVQGGSGSLLFPTPSPAIVTTRSELTLTGDAATAIRAGFGGQPEAGVRTTGGTVTADTLIQVAGSGGGPPFTGSANVVRQRVASVWGSGAGPGGTVSFELVSPTGEPINVVASVPADPVRVPPGIVFIDTNLVVPLFMGLQNPGGRLALAFPVPQDATLRGLRLVFQAAHFHVSRNEIEFANPAVIVVD